MHGIYTSVICNRYNYILFVLYPLATLLHYSTYKKQNLFFFTVLFFGYDFIIDSTLQVWLCEINASPAVAEQLMPKLVRDLIGRTVDAESSALPPFGDSEPPSSDMAQARAACHGTATLTLTAVSVAQLEKLD